MIGGSRTSWVRSMTYTVISLMVALSVTGLLIRVGTISVIWIMAVSVLATIILFRSRAMNRSAMYQSFAAVDSDQNRRLVAKDFITHNTGSVRSRAQYFLISLSQYNDWSRALEQSKIAKTPYEKLACRVRQRFGDDIDQVLSPLIQSSRVQLEAERMLARMYPIPIAVVGFVLLGLVMSLIVPTFKQIYEEFELETPSAMLSVFNVSSKFSESGWWIFYSCMLVAACITCIFVMFAWVFPKLTQHYPLRLFTQAYYRSFGLLSLSIALRHETDASAACRTAAELMPVGFIGSRLNQAANYIQQGLQPAVALYVASLISKRQSTLLNSAEKSQNFPWSIESLAVTTAEKTLRVYSIMTQIAVVVFVLFLAGLYGYFAKAVLELLTQMIIELARIS